MQFLDVGLSPIAPAASDHMLREAPRPPLGRQTDYEDRFDATTLFYDCFWSADHLSIVCVGPNLGSYAELLNHSKAIARPSLDSVSPQIGDFGTIAHVVFPVPSGTTDLLVETPVGTFAITPQSNLQDLFAGKRALVSMSLNNPLNWIRDWAWFYVRHHGTNALLFYDNGSEFYAKQDIRAALETVPGLDFLVIPDWPYRFGAPRHAIGGNDSRFLQRGMLEHARHRFLQQASSVVHTDIDELVIPLGGEGLHQAAEAARTGYVRVSGQWVEPVLEDGPEADPLTLSHRSWRHRLKDPRPTGMKIAVAPTKHTHRVFWTVHKLYGRKPDPEQSKKFALRHFFGLKTQDTDARNIARLERVQIDAPDPDLHEEDPILMTFFRDNPWHNLPEVAPYAVPNRADTARVLAGQAHRTGRLNRAIALAERAVSLAPDQPNLHDFLAQLLRQSGDDVGADAATTRATDLRVSNPESAALLVRAARAEDDPDAALDIVTAALERSPTSGLLYLSLSDVYATIGRLEDCAAAADKAADLGLDSLRLHWRRGLANIRINRVDIAKSAYEAMVSAGIETHLDWIRYYRGVIRIAQMEDRPAQVITLAQDALTRLDAFPETTHAERKLFQDLIGGDQGTTNGSYP